MQHLHEELELGSHDLVEVTLNGRANVMLLDAPNYERYQHGASFQYHGGLAQNSPAVLTAPRAGRWHLVVDLGGFPGKLRAGWSVVHAAHHSTAGPLEGT